MKYLMPSKLITLIILGICQINLIIKLYQKKRLKKQNKENRCKMNYKQKIMKKKW